MLQRREFIKTGLLVAASTSLTQWAVPAKGQSIAEDASTAATCPRRRELLDADWRFQALAAKPANHAELGSKAAFPQVAKNFNDSVWRVVQLPHDFIVEGNYNPKASKSHGYLPVFPAWYRKHFSLAESDRGKAIWIDFEGVYRDAHVYLNGHFLGRHRGGYTPFRFDIANVAEFGGDNVLAVYVDPTEFEGWWYEGGGIYRHVWLNVADPVHVKPWGIYVVSKVHDVCTHPSAELSIQTCLVNDSSDEQHLTIDSHVLDTKGTLMATVSGQLTVSAGNTAELLQTARLSKVSLWSLEDRHLYSLLTVVRRGEERVDFNQQKFGVRTLRYDANHGFFLNEKHVKLKGTCNHQDFVGVGIGAPDSLWYWRVRKLKELGCNAVRCSHNMMAPAYYDACDELGVLVMDENRHLSDDYTPKSHIGDPYKNAWHVDEMVLRDRNHPSVIMWSLCNEEMFVQNSEYGEKVFAYLMKSIHQYDRTRPITCAMNANYSQGPQSGWEARADLKKLRGFEAVEDLQGCNYAPNYYAKFHKDHPEARMFGSEIGNSEMDRGIYKTDIAAGFVSSYNDTMQSYWPIVAADQYIAGGFIWTGFDYRGEPSPTAWPTINSHFGVLDMCGFPKDIAMYYQAWWGDKPLVHIFPHWNWPGHEGKSISVWCYSNCDEIELRINGRGYGRKKMPPMKHLQWEVPYTPGHIDAHGYNCGVLAATHRIETTAQPAAMFLTADRHILQAGGQDTVPIAVAVVDAAGRVVPTANNRVHFTVTGAGVNAGVGNGDPNCHEPNQANYRSAFNGWCMVLARAGRTGGMIHVRATAAGLKPADVELLVRS